MLPSISSFFYLSLILTSLAAEILPPHPIIFKNITTAEHLLIEGGPPNPLPQSVESFQLPILGMTEKLTSNVIFEVKEGLRYIFQTKNNVTLAIHGTGSLAMETLLANLVEPGDTVLIPTYGHWTEVAADVVQRLNGIPLVFNRPWGSVFPPEEINSLIASNRPSIVFLVHGESSTGQHQSLAGIGSACREYGCILIVDAVHTVGLQPFFMDAWEVDAVYCNTQKGIGAPVGLAPLSISERALAKIMQRNVATPSRIYDVKRWIERNHWFARSEEVSDGAIHSVSVLLLYTLRKALQELAIEGLEARWNRSAEIHSLLRERMKEEIPNIQFVGDPETYLVGAIPFYPPRNRTSAEVSDFILKKYGILVGYGYGPSSVKYNRVALIAANLNDTLISPVVIALKDAWASLQYNAS